MSLSMTGSELRAPAAELQGRPGLPQLRAQGPGHHPAGGAEEGQGGAVPVAGAVQVGLRLACATSRPTAAAARCECRQGHEPLALRGSVLYDPGKETSQTMLSDNATAQAVPWCFAGETCSSCTTTRSLTTRPELAGPTATQVGSWCHGNGGAAEGAPQPARHLTRARVRVCRFHSTGGSLAGGRRGPHSSEHGCHPVCRGELSTLCDKVFAIKPLGMAAKNRVWLQKTFSLPWLKVLGSNSSTPPHVVADVPAWTILMWLHSPPITLHLQPGFILFHVPYRH